MKRPGRSGPPRHPGNRPTIMKKPPAKPFHASFGALALAVLLSGCASEPSLKVGPERLVRRHDKDISRQEFIGFADGRAFSVVTLVPFAPWSIPETVIWWCPVHELTPEQLETLKSRMAVPESH